MEKPKESNENPAWMRSVYRMKELLPQQCDKKQMERIMTGQTVMTRKTLSFYHGQKFQVNSPGDVFDLLSKSEKTLF